MARLTDMPASGRANRSGGHVLVLLGIALILAAAMLVCFNVWNSNRAGKDSEALLDRLEHAFPDPDQSPTPADLAEALDPGAEMPTVMLDGVDYVGVISIPSQGITLPVASDWSYPLLRQSPCRFSGTASGGDLVICGHNYATHFSPLKWIEPGAEVIFTTVDNVEYRYLVSTRETVGPNSVEQMILNENNAAQQGVASDWDLTLFTCNTGGQTRCAVRCVRTANG